MTEEKCHKWQKSSMKCCKEILEFSSKISDHKRLNINKNNVKFYLELVRIIFAVCIE